MSSLRTRRILVWVAGMGLGFLLTALFVTLILPWMGPQAGNAISIQKYGGQYFFWTAPPLGPMFVLWLDYFLKTEILPK